MYDSSESKRLQIAIDGPAGAGKSTVARMLAERLGITLLDTGAMYRAFALLADRHGLSADSPDSELEELFKLYDLSFEDGRVLLGGIDVSQDIRTPDIDRKVSPIASNPAVRRFLVEKQREIAHGQDVVMEGRDIGSVVLKDAPFKFYLDASVSRRAIRRMEQNALKGVVEELDAVEADIRRRDENDFNRAESPLVRTADAIYINSDGMSADEVVEYIVSMVV